MTMRNQSAGRPIAGRRPRTVSAVGGLEGEIDQALERLKDGIEQEDKALDALLSRLRGLPAMAA